MLVKKERTGGTWAGLGILALGIAIGSLARPERWTRRTGAARPDAAPSVLAPQLQPAASPERARDNGLTTIELTIPADSAARLQAVRDAALERGVIVQDEKASVPARFAAGGASEDCELRIKGDWTDHVDSERWSYRIRLRSADFLGMREFSIQAPKTRGYLWEWLVHETARRERVLVPRSTFVNVVQNGHAMGVYFLEEHFEKELLESQGRREGPIVVWDEDLMWSTLLQEGNVPAKGVRAFESALDAAAHTLDPAEVRAFGEKRLSSMPGLNQALFAAIDQMKALRGLALAQQPESERMRVLQAQEDLRGRTLEDLVDVDRLGCAHALASVFQLEHSLAWHNTRWYRDPVQARLEPILFDNAAQDPGPRDPVPFRARDLTAAFARSPGYYEALFVHLGRMLRSDWLDQLFAAIDPDLARFEAALAADGTLPAGCSVGEMKQRLRAQVIWLRKACLPADEANFAAQYRITDEAQDPGAGTLEVDAWATTRSPVLVEGFRFGNGSFSSAAGVLAPGALGAHARGQGVVLPADGRVVGFRFAMNERLANLETIKKIKQAIRESLSPDKNLDLDVKVVHRLLASEEERSDKLVFRHAPSSTVEEGRPAAPSLAAALAQHAFLRFDFAHNELTALAGAWDVDGDLVLPSGIGLALGPGTTLRFQPGHLLLADAPLHFVGTTAEPIVFEPVEGASDWNGIVVLGAAGRSEWNDVIVRKTDAAARGGWILTGAVTFYRSPIAFTRCRFEGTQAEDGVNVFGADVRLDGVTFSGCHSDSFDGDFITGEIANCRFEDGLADGIDVSGSDISARDCHFAHLGDKAYSIGERSRARISGGEALDVGVGIASKDASSVEVEGFAVEARMYALAAFIKKPEYGAARLSAKRIDVRGAGRGVAIAQTGCELELDGTQVPTQEIDVEASYREGVLGHAK